MATPSSASALDLGACRRLVVEHQRQRDHDAAALRRVARGELGHRPAQVLDGVLGHLVPLLGQPDRAVGGGRGRGRQPGQVLLASRQRDRLCRAGQHLVPLRVGRQSRARVSSRSIRSLAVPRGSRRWAAMAAATSCSASTHENVRRACSAASAAARHARLTCVGPAASQCRASSAMRSSGPTRPATSGVVGEGVGHLGVESGQPRRAGGRGHGIAGERVRERHDARPRAPARARPPVPGPARRRRPPPGHPPPRPAGPGRSAVRARRRGGAGSASARAGPAADAG